MAARLILNADDFGLTRGVNRSIGELHAAGVLTSATLMATGRAFDDAVATAHAHPGLSVGCHIVFVDGVPVSHPADIPSLLGPDEKTFRTSLADFALAVLLGKVSEEELAREALAQIQRLQRAGIDVTHLDTHKHTHILPGVARPLLWVAERTSVGSIRNPFEPAWSAHIGAGSPARRFLVRALRPLQQRFQALPQIAHGRVLTTDGTLGISATGNLNKAALAELLATMPHSGLWELVCHPGYNDHDLDAIPTRLRATREIEQAALLQVLSGISMQPNPPQLIHYGSLGAFGALREAGQFVPASGHESYL
jgi:predicted glycoside hydrolase/deacetylase ChbG (UPF0249 family)